MFEVPSVSVIVPVKNSQKCIGELVNSLLCQVYAGRIEVILVGDPGDPTWGPIREQIRTGQIIAIEAEITSPARDANAKRNIGLEAATGDILALTDSDMILPQDWVQLGVKSITSGHHAVAGSMIAANTSFWGDYVDQNPVGSKTPRMDRQYVLTSANYARAGNKPPVTANFFCTRKVYETVGGLDVNFTRSYEDYEWFRRMVDHGYDILCDNSLAGHHYHRSGFRALLREYLDAGWGCADYIVTFPRCHLSIKRLVQWKIVTIGTLVGLGLLAWQPVLVLLLGLAMSLAMAGLVYLKVRRIEAMLYPFVTLILSASFTHGITRRFLRQLWRKPTGLVIGDIDRLQTEMEAA